MLLLGRSWGTAAHAIRLSQEHSGHRNSKETWSSPRADTTTAAASCRVPGQALCAALLSQGLCCPQLLWWALPRNEEMAFLMWEKSQLKEVGCPKHNAMPQRESCWISLPCLHPTILISSLGILKLLIFPEQRGTFTDSMGLLSQLLPHSSWSHAHSF